MSRRSLFLAIAIVLFLTGSTCAIVYLLYRHEPAFYVRANLPPGEQRKKLSEAFFAESVIRLYDDWFKNVEWKGHFKEEQINSYFAEDFITKHSTENPLPEGISEPRVSFDTDRIRLGFRYGGGWTSTVISMDMRIWLVPKESNVVALAFEGIHAGMLPISAQSLLERVADFAHQRDIEVTWYRHNGRPVLVLRFEADRSNPRFRLKQLDLRPGMFRIRGRTLDGTEHAVALPETSD